MITELEQSTLDIDWFFLNKNKIGFVASAGGRLPKSISKSQDDIQLLSSYFRSLPRISDIEVNPKLEEVMINRKIDESYLSDFIFMAQKGLYVFDKTFLNNFNDDIYHLVAMPTVGLNINDLPSNIYDILCKTRNDDDIDYGFKCSGMY
jgi:hypothetical protein